MAPDSKEPKSLPAWAVCVQRTGGVWEPLKSTIRRTRREAIEAYGEFDYANLRAGGGALSALRIEIRVVEP